MESVKKIRAFYYQDNDGNKLTMFYGRLVEPTGAGIAGIVGTDNAQRWCFIGKKIPMPVRCYTWFQGLNSYEMNRFVESTGYKLVMTVNLITGTVWHCPTVNEHIPDMDAIKYHIEKLYNGNNKHRLIRLYKTISGCNVSEAEKVVTDIIKNIGN